MKNHWCEYRVFVKGVAVEFDLVDIVGDDVDVLIHLQQCGAVNVASSGDMNAGEDLIPRGQAQSGQGHVGLIGGLQSVGVRDVVGFSQLHQVHRVVVLDVSEGGSRMITE